MTESVLLANNSYGGCLSPGVVREWLQGGSTKEDILRKMFDGHIKTDGTGLNIVTGLLSVPLTE